MSDAKEQWGSIALENIKQRKYDSLIVVDDIEAFNKMTQHIVKYVGQDGDYIIVELNGLRGRVKPAIFKKLVRKPPAFVNDDVKLCNSKGKLEFGIVRELFWHDKREGYIFSIEVNGKMKTRGYEEKDIEKLQ